MRARHALPLLVGLVLVATAGPAVADPAGPTPYRSTVTGVDPDLDAIDLEVLGGDAYVHLVVAPGTTATVDGYEGEPYLRFLADGTVERNEASPARWLNDARFGALDVAVPPGASAEVPPRWEVVADGGSYAWHDHRVHWMSPGLPPQVDAGASQPQRVTDWTLTLAVDDEPVVVAGELDLLPARSPIVPATVTLALLAGALWLVSRHPRAIGAVVLVGAVTAASVGVAGAVDLPAGADADVALLLLPAVAALLTVVAFAIRRRPGAAPRVVAGLAGVPLVIWSVLLVRAYVSPIVPTVLPTDVARVLVAAVPGCGLAAVVAAARAVWTAPDVTSGPDAVPTAG